MLGAGTAILVTAAAGGAGWWAKERSAAKTSIRKNTVERVTRLDESLSDTSNFVAALERMESRDGFPDPKDSARKSDNDLLFRTLSRLEMVSAEIVMGMIDEDVARSLLSKLLVSSYQRCRGWIEAYRRQSGDVRVFENLEMVAKRWQSGRSDGWSPYAVLEWWRMRPVNARARYLSKRTVKAQPA